MRLLLLFVLSVALLAVAPVKAGPVRPAVHYLPAPYAVYYPMPAGGPAPQAVPVQTAEPPLAVPAAVYAAFPGTVYTSSVYYSGVSYGPVLEYQQPFMQRGPARRFCSRCAGN